MQKIEREYRKLCAAEGFKLLDIETGASHYVLHFGCGRVIAPCTPSNHRYLKDVRAQMRRLHLASGGDTSSRSRRRRNKVARR